jgi:hypothetical protein
MTAATQEPKLHVFFSTIKSMQTITPSGGRILFVSGTYYTKDEEEIQFLNEMARKNRGVYTQPDMLTISEADRDPMQALRNKVRAEIMAEMQGHLNPENDRGTSVQGNLNPASTRDMAPVAAGGDATQLHNQVSKLVAGATKK